MKRLALYVFYEKEGIVRDYVTYYLNGLKEVAADILVIVNGKLTLSGRTRLESLGMKILVRENKGLDFAAWKAGLEYWGQDNVRQYDELILCNCSCYGPVYPFAESFQKMEQKNCDFWGMTRHPSAEVYLIDGDPRSKIEEHLQSFFIVFRKKLLSSDHFWLWWQNLMPADTYWEEVGLHETKFTVYFENAGYTSGCMMDAEKYFELLPHDNSAMLYTDKLLTADRIPLVKRKLFVNPDYWWSNKCMGHLGSDTLTLLQHQTKYPVQAIWQDLLAAQKFSEVKDALHLTRILPADTLLRDEQNDRTVALLCFVYYPDLCETMLHYIRSMPESAHICIISSREDTLDIYRAHFAALNFSSVEFRLKPNRGRDVSAYLIAGRDILQEYDLICCIHDKKSKQLSSQLMAAEFAMHGLENCLHSKEYVSNIIHLFSQEPFCGLLVPPTVYFGDFATLGAESWNNKQSMQKVYTMLELTCPMDDTPTAPFGSYFWARGKALGAMFRHDWKYEDFPDEPLPTDGTLSHGIERIWPLAVQQAGYYTAWCSPDTYASLYMNNLSYMLREYNRNLYQLYGVQNWTVMNAMLKNAVSEKFSPVKNAAFNKTKYLKYKILSKITVGKTRRHYKTKYHLLKQLRRNKNFIDC